MIIVTVPHALCPHQSQNHQCDFGAIGTARLLEQLALRRGKPIMIFPGNVGRNICDLNRDTCQSSLYREILRSEVYKYHQVSLIDIHSFPRGSFPTNKKFVFLYVNPSDYLPIPEAGWIPGGENSIVDEFHGKVTGPVLLLEVDELTTQEERKAFLEHLLDYL